MNCFRLPKALCKDINNLVANFWWGQQKEERRIHWIAWDRICEAKSKGGFGFKELQNFNMALLAKQGWRLLANSNSLLAMFLKGKYFLLFSFMDAQVSRDASLGWRSILCGRKILNKGLRWSISGGTLQIRALDSRIFSFPSKS
ncbi:hypothetical protein P3X46_023538 [Hevea brasiliensis]|uniref:Reverse transcriptase zinc-binding domain-containing protein n=1 Tax=Hevea brasiliensis TaxID=3981 RepID=A0ABQ9LBB2_HEVBR|nr:hypothetical protein P3X46_023538 [Hevea brasiliensis]